uniref:Polysaccharide biosynthesis protein C-terminal domain-containing protein n=1 Tax=candidate division WOR-3 bacterium TaxID=2052148 RepID=A0A7V3RFR1_UNCW3
MEDNSINLKHLIKKLGKDSIIYAPAKLITGFINIISGAIFTRIFNPDDYGHYILILTTTTILSAIFSQWIMQSILRYRPEYVINGKKNIFNKNFLLILLLNTVFISLLTAGIYPFNKILGNYRNFYLISFFIVVSQIWFDNLGSVFQADLKSFTYSFYTIFNSVLKLGLALILILLSRNITALLWSIVLSYIFSSIPMVIILLKSDQKTSIQKRTYDNGTIEEGFTSFSKQFFSYGFPMIGWFLGAQLLNMSDRYFIQIFRGSEEVGIYGANYNLVASVISFLSMPLLTAAHPLLMKAGTAVRTNKEEVQNIITLFSRYFLIIAIPTLLYVSILSKELANISLGLEYRQGYVILPIILFGLLVWSFALFGHKGLEFRGKTNIMFMYVMICTALKIILSLIFVPRYGYKAAAITTSICFFMYPVFVYYGTKSDIKWIIPWMSLAKITISAFLSAIPMIFIKILWPLPSFLLTLFVASIIPIYFIMLYFLKEFSLMRLIISKD